MLPGRPGCSQALQLCTTQQERPADLLVQLYWPLICGQRFQYPPCELVGLMRKGSCAVCAAWDECSYTELGSAADQGDLLCQTHQLYTLAYKRHGWHSGFSKLPKGIMCSVVSIRVIPKGASSVPGTVQQANG
jgi:hypothetical protein